MKKVILRFLVGLFALAYMGVPACSGGGCPSSQPSNNNNK